MFIVVAEFEMAPEDIERTIEVSKAVILETRKEPGNISYDYAQDLFNPAIFRIAEKWESEEALAAHMVSPHVAQFLEDIAGLNMLSIEALRYGVSGVKDMMQP